jgi:hypothetical protein
MTLSGLVRRVARGVAHPARVKRAAGRALAVARFRRALLATPPMPSGTSGSPGGPELHTIASRQTALEAIATAKSFNRFVDPPLPVVVHDDGTLRPRDVQRILAHLPGARVIRRADADREIDGRLAERGLTRCRALRRDLVFALKLFDIPAYAGGRPVLYTDSDVLCYAEPTAILDALRNGRDTFNHDVSPGRAWPDALIEERLGIRPDAVANAGLLVVHDILDEWPFFESCLARLPEPESLYYAEQTLFGILLSRRGARALPDDYDVCFRASWRPPDYHVWLAHARGSEAMTTQHFCGGIIQRSWYYRHFVEHVAPALMKR